MGVTEVLLNMMQQFLFGLIEFVPKLLIALIIWIIGEYFIKVGARLIRKLEFPEVKPANKLIKTFAFIIVPVGKIILLLVVLDYLGIGRTVISALLSGLSFAFAIALGIAFGRALEDDAKEVVEAVKKQLEK